VSASREHLIQDLQNIANTQTGQITRDYYREVGKYSDKQVAAKFATFNDFCIAAGVNKPSATSEIDGDKWSVFIPSTEFCSADEVIKYCAVDMKVWELDRFRAKDVSKDDGPKFQISAFFRKRKNILAIMDEIEDLKNQAKMAAPQPSKIERTAELTGNMLEIGLNDVHFGKLAWPKETGHEPYDVHIAQAMYVRALDSLIERTRGYKFDEIVYVVGNDIMNSDNAENQTTKGTVVTTDVRYHKTFKTVRFTVQACIEKLRKLAPVKVIIVPGNHDQLASWHLGDSLECWFHNYTDVIIENQPRYRKYHQFGKVMLGFTHGDKGDRKDYPLLMATEMSEMFGTTKFREMHTGHTHTTKLDEQMGVRVRVLPALCPPDDWHSENGYVGNLRNAEAYIWNREQGLISIVFYNDDSQAPLITKRAIV
jgi:hypothetical protein